MSALTHSITKVIRRRERADQGLAGEQVVTVAPTAPDAQAVEISPNDPIVAYFQGAAGVVEVDSLDLVSPAVEALKAAGVKLVVPLVSQGELIGVVNLGARLSDQAYSTDDKKLLVSLAAQAAPALQVAQLVRRQEAEARSRERIEQELRVATLIQQHFLPKSLPDLPGWQISAYYRPAREVGGDFYDFIELPEGQVGVVIGDVTDKGVPAAMVMAATRSVLRASAQRIISPGVVLGRVNELMCPDMPPKMFVTCLYGVVDPATGRFRFANAGHNLPYVRTDAGTIELRATGMPLGLMPGIVYEEREAILEKGQTMLLHSDGVAEAHNADGEMFGFPRLLDVVGGRNGRGDVIDRVLTELGRFTPAGRRTGGRHHPRRAQVRRARVCGSRDEGCRHHVHDRQRARQRAARDGQRRRGSGAARARAGATRTAQDRRVRGDDERDRARERGARRPAGRDQGSRG